MNPEFVLTDIEWERIFLKFTIDGEYTNKSCSFFLARFNGKELRDSGYSEECVILEKVPLAYYKVENNKYYFCLNITAAKNRTFLNNGKWTIYADIEGTSKIVHVQENTAYSMECMDRVFFYNAEKYSYNVSFDLTSEDSRKIKFYLNSYFMKVNNNWKKRRYIEEGFSIGEKFDKLLYFVITRCIRLYYKIYRLLVPNKGKRVLFMTETKDYLSGNLKYIYNRMFDRGLDKEFKISVSCRKVVGDHQNVLSWVKTVNLIAKQDYIFIDDYAPVFGFLNLGKNVKLIQVWHAGEGFKSVGYSRFGREGTPFPNTSCHKMYDYALTGSKKLVKVYEEVFGIEKEAFLPVGMPRLDDFLDNNRIANFRSEFYKKYNALEGKKIILFAPTYRGKGQRDAYYDYGKIDLERIYNFCGDEYAFVIKMHPFITERISVPEKFNDRIFDFSKYQDINELYYVTEILITDYSSNYYEYALMKKPVLFYTYDRVVYQLTRGVHRDVKETAPGKVCDTFDELMTALENKDYELDKLLAFNEANFGDYDGHACDRVIDRILLKKEN